jgi:hypothetical protein
MAAQFTPELVAHVADIVRERGITEAEFTPELAGELLDEASRRIAGLVTELTAEFQTARSRDFWRHFPRPIYVEAVARGLAAAQ